MRSISAWVICRLISIAASASVFVWFSMYDLRCYSVDILNNNELKCPLGDKKRKKFFISPNFAPSLKQKCNYDSNKRIYVFFQRAHRSR